MPKPYDPAHPVLCMDEQPVQLLKETQVPIAATTKHGEACRLRIRTNGTASIFMFARTAVGLSPGDRPRATDQGRLGDRSGSICWTRVTPLATKVTLVCDNLNTHTKGAFYAAFAPATSAGVHQADQLLLHAQARQLAEHRRMRVELPDEPVPERPPHRHDPLPPTRDRGLVRQDQRQTTRRRLAIPHRRRPPETEIALPQILM